MKAINLKPGDRFKLSKRHKKIYTVHSVQLEPGFVFVIVSAPDRGFELCLDDRVFYVTKPDAVTESGD